MVRCASTPVHCAVVTGFRLEAALFCLRVCVQAKRIMLIYIVERIARASNQD